MKTHICTLEALLGQSLECPACEELKQAAAEIREIEADTTERTIRICNDCYELKGGQCHNPSCVFCRKSMAEVGYLLDAIMIRPVVDGERLRL